MLIRHLAISLETYGVNFQINLQITRLPILVEHRGHCKYDTTILT